MKTKNPIFLLLLVVPPPHVAAQTAEKSGGHSGVFTPITILIITITVVFFLTGAVAVLIRHLCDGCLGLYAATAAAGGLPAAPGLDADSINSIPTYLYSEVKEHRIEKVELECAVCLCEFEDSDILRLLPGCCHVFHPQCIDPWLASHATCPICRQSLLEPESGTLRPHTIIDIPPSGTESNGHDQATIELDDHHDDHHDHELSGDDYHEKNEIVGKFARSHSTGHSLADAKRFALSSPDKVRSENGGGALNCMVSPRTEYRRTGWFSMTPPLILPRPGWVCPPIPPV